MKIAYFTDTYAPEVNGVTNTLSRLGKYLDEKQIKQLIFAPDYDEENIFCESAYRTIHRFAGITSSLSPRSRLAFPPFWKIDEICDMYEPDIIHVTTELGIGFRGMRYALSRNIPLVMSFHTNFSKYLKYHNLEFVQPVLENYLEWFHSFSARTLVPSRHTLAELFQKGYRNLGLWSRGIDRTSFNPGYRNEELRTKLGKDKFIFLYAGRLSAEKNLDMLLGAAGSIERRFPGMTTFIFTGDGPYAEKIQNKGIPNVVLTGFKKGKELSEIYASADCFTFPSATETFGNVVLEALSSGLPVVSVCGGGITDFLIHNYNSLLCDPEDTVLFTENLVSVMQNKKLRSDLSINALKTAMTRDWDNVFNCLVDVYHETIDTWLEQNIRKTA